MNGFDVVTLDSPANRNALSLGLMEELLGRIESSGGRGLVLDHTGDVFCSGVDLRERRERSDAPGAHSRLLARVLIALWEYPKPVVCRVAGAVRGGGMGLVACSDLVVASPAATFAYSEVRVGVAPALVCALALQKIPLGQLLPHLVSGETFDAPTAQRVGLVTAIADDADVAPYTASVAAAAPNAVRTTKAIARRVAGAADVRAVVAEMEDVSAQLFGSAEAAEGMAAFAERRAPAWAG